MVEDSGIKAGVSVAAKNSGRYVETAANLALGKAVDVLS